MNPKKLVKSYTKCMFDEDKARMLGDLLFDAEEKRDKSRAGCVDRDIKSFVETVNRQPDLYTTSSCAGRFIVTCNMVAKPTPSPSSSSSSSSSVTPKSRGYGIEWLSVTHELDAESSGFFQPVLAKLDALQDLESLGGKSSSGDEQEISGNQEDNELWFKLEPPLVAVCARSVAHGQLLLNVCRGAGLKRASIVAVKQDGRPVLAIADTQRVETLIARNGRLLVNREYLDLMLEAARDKLRKSRTRFELLRGILDKPSTSSGRK